MNRFLYLSLIAAAALLLVAACGPAPMQGGDPTRAATSVPATQPPQTPEASSTPIPATQPRDTPEPRDTAQASPTTPAPAEPSPSATSTPAPSPETIGTANADVLYVRAVEAAEGTWTFHVTVQHPDTGWEDYADGWDVLTQDDTVLKPDPDSPFTRLLLHPHESEQPFTRSQSGIVIPPGVTLVRVRAHDLVDGFGGREVVVDLTALSGEDFEVERNP
jgi:hypothetical protein